MRLKLFLALFGALAIPAVAHADDFNFNLTGSGGGFSGSGTLTAVNNGSGQYTITGVRGSGSGAGITGLTSYNGNDNLLFPNSNPVLDSHGFSFIDKIGADTLSVNIYSAGTSYFALIKDQSSDPAQVVPVTFTLAAATPEPSSFALFGTGLLGVAGLVRKRLRS